MTRSANDSGKAIVIPLPRELDMKAASPLRQAILTCRGRDLALDGSAVSRLGGQCLQVILSAVRTWAADGRAFSIVSPSLELVEHLELLGVRPADIPTEIAA